MSRARLAVVILLAAAGSFLSGLLLLDHYGVASASGVVDQACGPEEESGCDRVSQSRFSSVGEFSVAGIGLVFYASAFFLAALALVATDAVRSAASALALLLVGAALVVDMVLLGVQVFEIGAFCSLCLATYVVNLGALLVLSPARRFVSSLGKTLFGSEGRPALLVWVAGSLALLIFVGFVEQGLASAAAATEITLLGGPIAPAEEPVSSPPELEPTPLAGSDPEPVVQSEPEPVAEPALSDSNGADNEAGARIEALEAELKQSRAEVHQLRATLDDPEKYQEYQTEKATQQFEKEPVRDVALEGIPFKGPADAPIRVAEFSDFLCPFCRNLAGAFANYMTQSSGQVAIYYKNYPLDQACNPGLSRTLHDGACEVALGAICAHEQGRFWPYHDRVFSSPPTNPSVDDVVGIASAAGLNGDALRQCMGSPAAEQALSAQIQEAKRLEVTSTPTVFINGKKLQQLGGFLAAIESEAKRLGLDGSP
ncbi:MAG TPA: vitamin K epoxide reductase family protein [Vicinamibacteria bacterium]|nr:vitamin K epoxide reductase family protein [Vicinamibacteria bacterium]